MKLVPNDSAKMLVKENCELIHQFIIEHLDGLDKQQLLESLNIRIEQYEGNQNLSAGEIKVSKDYWDPLITLYKDALMIELADPYWQGWSFNQLRLLVLFHELSHMVILLSDIEGNMPFFKSKDNIFWIDPEEETLCNVMAERFLRRNGFFSNVKNVYFSPDGPNELLKNQRKMKRS